MSNTYDVTGKNNTISFEGLNRLAAILSIMSVSTFITAVVLYMYVSGTVQSET